MRSKDEARPNRRSDIIRHQQQWVMDRENGVPADDSINAGPRRRSTPLHALKAQVGLSRSASNDSLSSVDTASSDSLSSMSAASSESLLSRGAASATRLRLQRQTKGAAPTEEVAGAEVEILEVKRTRAETTEKVAAAAVRMEAAEAEAAARLAAAKNAAWMQEVEAVRLAAEGIHECLLELFTDVPIDASVLSDMRATRGVQRALRAKLRKNEGLRRRLRVARLELEQAIMARSPEPLLQLMRADMADAADAEIAQAVSLQVLDV